MMLFLEPNTPHFRHYGHEKASKANLLGNLFFFLHFTSRFGQIDENSCLTRLSPTTLRGFAGEDSLLFHTHLRFMLLGIRKSTWECCS